MTTSRPGEGYRSPRTTEDALRAIKVPTGPAPGASARLPMLTALSGHQRRLAQHLVEMSEVLVEMAGNLERVERQRDLATDQRNDAGRIVEEARHAAEQILHFTREHPDREFDLKPLLDALQMDTEEQP